MKLTDGKKTVEIKIQKWNGTGYDPDWSNDFFEAGNLPYDEETDTYTVDDVEYCIDMAMDEARLTVNEDGENVIDEDMHVVVTEI
jgi:hypothetical protein